LCEKVKADKAVAGDNGDVVTDRAFVPIHMVEGLS
jgi:hypothetical protein